MRRLAAVALGLAVALPACAQHAGGGGHGGFAPHGAPSFQSAPASHAAPAFHSAPSFSTAPAFSSAPRSAPLPFGNPGVQRPQAFRGGYAPSPGHAPLAPPVRSPQVYTMSNRGLTPMNGYAQGLSTARPSFYNRNHGFDDRHHGFDHGHHGFHNQSFGFFPYPFIYGPGYWAYDSPYDSFLDEPYDDPVYNNLSNSGLAPGPPAPDADSGYAGPSQPYDTAPPPQYQSAPPAPASPEMQYVPGSVDAVTLIFKDGRPPEQIRNYLATRTTITVVEGHHRRDIPVSALDLPATIKANRETGADFELPTSR